MGLEFLARVRRTTLWLTAIAALLIATYRDPARGHAVLLGALWSVLNLTLIERLVVALTDSDRGTAPALRRAVAAVAGKWISSSKGNWVSKSSLAMRWAEGSS